MSVWIEKSPSSRATCPLCKLPIKKGEVRVGGYMGSGIYPYHYHFECWLKRNKDFVADLLSIMLPRLFGDEVAQPLLIALSLKGIPISD
ncbi:MAG: hypothetical protein ACP5KV_04160 [Candidatus Methanomethylicaceae archaeon]